MTSIQSPFAKFFSLHSQLSDFAVGVLFPHATFEGE